MPDEPVVTEQKEQTQEQVESGAAFEASFKDARGDEPAPAKVETPQPTETKVEESKVAAPEEKPDPWVGVSPAVKAQLESISTQLGAVAQIDHRLKSAEGRWASVTKSLDELKTAAKAAATSVADAPTQAQIDKAALDTERWKTIREQFPEWAEAMDERNTISEKRFEDKIAAVRAAQQPVDVAKIRGEVVAEMQAHTDVLVEEARQKARLDAKYEDWEGMCATAQFKTWLAKQPAEAKALADSPRAKDAMKLLDSFVAADAAAKKREQEENQKRLKGAIQPKGTATPPLSTDENDAFESSFKEARA